MWVLYGILVFIVLLAIWILVKRSSDAKLKKLLRLKLVIEPSEVLPGEEVRFRLKANPLSTIKAKSVNGSIICHRYDIPKIKWVNELNLPFIGVGEVHHMAIFSLGKDLMFVENTDVEYSNVIPVPDDAMASTEEGGSHVEWAVKLTVNADGYAPAKVREKVKVLSGALYSRKKVTEDASAADDVSDSLSLAAGKAPRSNRVLLVDGGERKAAAAESTASDSFSFLELDDNTQENR